MIRILYKKQQKKGKKERSRAREKDDRGSE
jgi:hypothetical protein